MSGTVVLAGLPAAGKSHWRRRFARLTSTIDCASVVGHMLQSASVCGELEERASSVLEREHRAVFDMGARSAIVWTPAAYAAFEQILAASVIREVVERCGRSGTVIEATPIFALALVRVIRTGSLIVLSVPEEVRRARLRQRLDRASDRPDEIAQFHRMTYRPALFALSLPRAGWTRVDRCSG